MNKFVLLLVFGLLAYAFAAPVSQEGEKQDVVKAKKEGKVSSSSSSEEKSTTEKGDSGLTKVKSEESGETEVVGEVPTELAAAHGVNNIETVAQTVVQEPETTPVILLAQTN